MSFTDVPAAKGTDYFGADKNVAHATGVSETTLEVTVKDDSFGEATGSFTASMATSTGDAALGDQTTTSVEIFDTDADFRTTATNLTIKKSSVA